MKRLLLCAAATALLSLGASRVLAGTDYDEIVSPGSYQQTSGSFENVPAGSYVVLEASVLEEGDSAYVDAYGDQLDFMSEGFTTVDGGDNEAYTGYESTVNYDIAVSGNSYAFIEIDW